MTALTHAEQTAISQAAAQLRVFLEDLKRQCQEINPDVRFVEVNIASSGHVDPVRYWAHGTDQGWDGTTVQELLADISASTEAAA